MRCTREGNDDKLPDPWQSCLDVKYRGLERGLELARRSVLSKINAYSKDATLDSSSVPSLSDLPLTTPVKQHGTMLTKEDRDCIQNFLETMLKQCIIPFVEKQLKLLNEQINARRGLSRSLTTGVRKLFSANTQPQSNISYSQESNEMQTRRLADMCFMFGLYSFAYQIYQSIKKEFALDQAGLYYAGALEMAAITYYLSNTNLNQYPQRYMENAIEYYTNTCLRPLLGVRAALLNSVILDSIDLNIEAASQLLRLANMENDLLSGMLEMRASEMFSKGNMPRKMAFHYILAGHRFFKCGLFKLSFDCYRNALPLFLHKQWSFAEDHLLYKLASESNNCTSLREALEWCSEIIKSLWTSQQQDADQQLTFIKLYLYLLKSYALDDNNNIPLIDIPFIKSQNVIVIHGDRPLRSCSDDHKDTINWKDVELAAYNKLNGSSLNFKSTPLVSDSTTDNSEMRCTPPFERLRFQFEFQNPFDISLTLKNIHLGLRNDTDLLELSSIDELVLEPKQRVDDVQLYVIPSDEVTEVHVTSVVFDVVVETLCVTAQIALSLRGARLCTATASKQVLYGKDERLNVSISAKRWPLLETEMIQPSSSIMQTYCNQISYVDCDLINIGSVPVQSFCIATNQFDLINVFDGDDSHSGAFKWISMEHCLSPINRNILLFKPVGNDHIAIGQRRRIRIAVRSPSEEVKGYRICLLLFYVGDNGMYREQRQTLSVDTRAVLSTSMRMVDESNGICVLSATNLISKRNSQLIANVELIRIKSIVNTDLRHSSTPPNVFLRTIRNRNGSFQLLSVLNHLDRENNKTKYISVHLECEQMDNYCFIVSSNNVNNSLTNLIYITNNNSDINDDNISFEWPSSPIANNDFNNYSMDSVNNKSLLSLSFAVLWRAMIGENIIKDPFPLVSSVLTDYKFMSAL
ncbi:unnamed protein product, partial [Anisakis simplex]|uniref:Trafficking protein particle complex subunit 8 (inferred by orthology to a human protein) n=1 Tax=Anisakis simplex TaxID=6269 RepID=A0A0M3J177_ANISI